MNEMEFLNNALIKIIDKLNSDSLNYVADVAIFRVFDAEADNVNDAVKSVFGSNTVVGGTSVSSSIELLKKLISGLSYVGDSGAHANKDYVGTTEHKLDLANVENKIKPLLAACPKVTSFWLKEGHPFYPVFWDFAFLIEGDAVRYIVVGSSSD